MSTKTDEAAQATIEAACRELHLPSVRQEAAPLAAQAGRERMSHRGYLAELLAREVDDRAQRRRTKRIAEARFPRMKRLEDFVATTSVTASTVSVLASCEWIERGEPVVLLGDSGTGKTHLLIGTGMAACALGKRVRYTTAAALVNELAEAQSERALSRVVARYGRLDLLLLDELGYVHLDPRGAELLFQIVTERDERASIAVATNAPFSEWGKTFSDPRLAAAVVDRLTFRALIIETGVESYRLLTTRQSKGGGRRK